MCLKDGVFLLCLMREKRQSNAPPRLWLLCPRGEPSIHVSQRQLHVVLTATGCSPRGRSCCISWSLRTPGSTHTELITGRPLLADPHNAPLRKTRPELLCPRTRHEAEAESSVIPTPSSSIPPSFPPASHPQPLLISSLQQPAHLPPRLWAPTSLSSGPSSLHRRQ